MITAWIVAGVVLMVLELIVPGMVLVFLGAGALTVALLVWLGLIQSWVVSITTWFILSLVFLLVLRGFFQRLMSGDTEKQSTDEDLDAFGEDVEVVEAIAPDRQGRIRYRGTTWEAACYEGTLEVGSTARIVYREDLVWVVEPADAPDAGRIE